MGSIVVGERNDMLDSIGTTVYLALSVGDLNAAGTEVSGTGYARIAVTLGAAAAGVKSNTSGPHVFTVGAGGWQSNVDYSALYDASTAGNLISTDALDQTRNMSVVGATMTFGVGDIDLTLT